MNKLFSVFGLILSTVLLVSCGKYKPDYLYYDEDQKAILDQTLNLPELPADYAVDFPEHLSRQGLFPRRVNDDRATLGRVLFYDKKLSRTGTIACASCHRQDIGFSDDKSVSLGVDDREGDRNAIALGSVANFSAYYGVDGFGTTAIRFLWDNRAANATDQAKFAITNPKEMDMTMGEVVDAVKAQPYYSVLFKMAYGENAISETNVLDAISNFIDAMGSYDSKFDDEARKKYSNGYSFGEELMKENFEGFSPQENAGKDVYMNKCASCHSAVAGRPMFNYANNGLDAVTGADQGVGGIAEFANMPGTEGAFKVPTLRNIALSAPYMHDGRFKNLQEVVEHYSSGIKNHPNLHPNLPIGGMNLSQKQKEDLIIFLQTMTDNTVAVNEKFKNPFK